MDVGFVKQKLFDPVQPNETNIQGQSLRSRQIVWLCPSMFVSLGWTESKRFCFTNPAFIHFSLSKVLKSGPYFKKVKKAHVHLQGLTFCVIFFKKSVLALRVERSPLHPVCWFVSAENLILQQQLRHPQHRPRRWTQPQPCRQRQ